MGVDSSVIRIAAVISLLAATVAAATPAARADEQSVTAYCSPQLRVFIDALGEVDTQLDFGVNFQEYRSLLVSAQRAYRRVPWKSTWGVCLSGVGVPGERALNAYIRAFNSWNSCIQRLTCNSYASNEYRQRQWRMAHANVVRAESNLD
jgi:hypothetical protein